MIWLLVGIAIGLVTAMLMLAGMLMIDGRRLRRRRVGAAAPAVGPRPDPPVAVPVTKPGPVPPRTVPPVPETRRWLAREPRQPLAPMPPREPMRAADPPKPLEDKPAVAATTEPDELTSALAAEIARVQVIGPAETSALPPPVEPDPVVPEPEPAPPKVLAPEPPIPTPAPAQAPVVEEPPRAVQPPKAPSLPKVTPARKFAPALPPRSPPAEGS